MSLGKGLESLIPPSNKGSGQGPTQGGQPEPANNSAPPADLPATEEEELLPDAINPAEELPSPSQITRSETWEGEPVEEELLPDAINPAEELPSPSQITRSETWEGKAEPAETSAPEAPRSKPVPAPASPAQNPRKETGEAGVRPAYVTEARPVKERGEAIFYLETGKIKPNEHQPRKHFDAESIRELAASIREFGVLQPIVVTKIEKDVPHGTEVEYQLIAGERRLLAAKSLGMERIPAIIRHLDLERERLELAIIENLQREDLNGIEMARAFARLQDEFRLTQREIAARIGKSRETVANTLRLLDLPSYIQEAIEKGELTASHGIFLLGVEDPAVQQALFHDLLEKKLTTRELRHKARVMGAEKAKPAALPPELKMFEEKLASELGTPVSIEQRGESGKITIEFYSEEELQALIRRLGGADE